MKFLIRLCNYLYVLFVIAVVSGLAGILVYYYCYKGQMTTRGLGKTLGIFLIFAIGLALIGIMLVEIIRLRKTDSLEKFLLKNGYCDEYYGKIKKCIGKKNCAKKTEGILFLAKELSDGERYDEAIDAIKTIELSTVTGGLLTEYYATYLYILVMSGDLADAAVLFSAGAEYLNGDSFAEMTVGIFNYAKGVYSEAEEYFLSASKKPDSDFTEFYSKMFLSLVYLKTDRKELAREMVSKLIPVVTNPRQKQDMKKLMLIVERKFVEQTADSNPKADETENNDIDIDEKGDCADTHAGSVD